MSNDHKKGLLSSQQKALISIGLLLIPILGYALVSAFPTVSNQGYAPIQPIPFSHKLHAGTHQMQCLYCHSTAEKSPHASVPGLSTCMNCHKIVKTDSPWIQKMQEAYTQGRPIEWLRVHDLPDHAHFSHNRHVAAGVSCQTCHGPVQEMEVVYQSAPLNMGWCMDCHRGETTPREVLNRMYPDSPDPKNRQVASVNCTSCHY
jgi:hypothetical protein